MCFLVYLPGCMASCNHHGDEAFMMDRGVSSDEIHGDVVDAQHFAGRRWRSFALLPSFQSALLIL